MNIEEVRSKKRILAVDAHIERKRRQETQSGRVETQKVEGDDESEEQGNW